MLAALDGHLLLVLAHCALEPQHDLLGGLCLLVEHGLGLAAEPGLLAVVAALALGKQRGLAGLVLRDLVRRVLAAVLALAERVARLGNVDHGKESEDFALAIEFILFSLHFS